MTPENVLFVHRQKLFSLLCVALLACLCIPRLINLDQDVVRGITGHGVFFSDEYSYSQSAIHFAKTGELIAPGEYNMIRSIPVFHLFQILSFKVFGLSLTALRIIPALFSICSILAIYACVSAMASRSAGLVAALVMGSNLLSFVYSRHALLESVFVSYGLIYLAFLARAKACPRFAWGICVIVLMMLTKHNSAFFFPVSLVAIWLAFNRSGQNSNRSTLIYSVCCVLTVGTVYILLTSAFSDHAGDVRRVLAPRMNLWNLADPGEYYSVFLRARKNVGAAFVYGSMLSFPILFTLGMRNRRLMAALLVCTTWVVAYGLQIVIMDYRPPRYFVPFVPPLAAIFGMSFCQVSTARWWQRSGQMIVLLILPLILFVQFRDTGSYLTGPEFTVQDVADSVFSKVPEDETVILYNVFILGVCTDRVCPTIPHGSNFVMIENDGSQWGFEEKYDTFGATHVVARHRPGVDFRIPGAPFSFELVSEYSMLSEYNGERVYLYRIRDQRVKSG